MPSYVISAQTCILPIQVQPPEDGELSDVAHRPSIIPDHLGVTDLGQPPPHQGVDGRQERAVANFNVSSDNQAGKDVQSTKSGSRSTQAGSRK